MNKSFYLLNTALVLQSSMITAQGEFAFPIPGSAASPGQDMTTGAPSNEQWRTREPDSGITTKTDDNRGNWYYKQRFFREAKPLYERIKSLVADIEKMQDHYFTKRSNLDKEVNQFYKDVGFEQGQVEEQVTLLIKQLEEERQKQGQLTEPERETLLELTATKQQVEQLRDNFQQIKTLDENLDKVISTLMDQLNLARKYQQKAWNNYETISEILNDQKAEQLYVEIKSTVNDVERIKSYLSGALSSYLDKVGMALRTAMNEARSRINELQKKGISLGKSIHAEKEAEEKARQEAEKKKKEDAEAKKKAQASRGWWASIKGWVTGWF
jgi:chromosome segregation ATPase